MFTKEMIDKIDKFLHDNLDIIFNFEFNGLLFLWGGAIKSIIMDTPVNDIDFVLLTQEEDNILEFIKKNKIDYKCPFIGVYNFNNYMVDLALKNDLHNYGYSTDLIFYDVNRKQIIPIGVKQSIKKRIIINYDYRGYQNVKRRKHKKKRLIDAKKFIQFMNKDNKRVRVVRKNNYYRRMFIGFLKHPSKIKKLFRES